MSDVLLLDIDLSGHRSIVVNVLFILAIDLQYNVPGEIILDLQLENCLHAIKFQQTASFRPLAGYVSSCLRVCLQIIQTQLNLHKTRLEN